MMRRIVHRLLSPALTLSRRFFDPRFHRLEEKLDRLAMHMSMPDARAPSTAAATFEVLTILGDRIQDIGDEFARQAESNERMARRLQALIEGLEERSESPARGRDTEGASPERAMPLSLADLSAADAELLNYAGISQGYSGQAGLWMNFPLWLRYSTGQVDVVNVNERIVELPFVFGAIARVEPGSTVLDVGCSESVVSLSLASLGYLATGIDMRPYPLRHPNLTVVTEPFESWDGPLASFDAAICLSAVEHFGLDGAYGACASGTELDVTTMRKLRTLMRPGGLLVFTAPFGDRFEIDQLQRTYDERALARLLESWRVERMSFAVQESPQQWRHLTRWASSDGAAPRRGVVLLTARPG